MVLTHQRTFLGKHPAHDQRRREEDERKAAREDSKELQRRREHLKQLKCDLRESRAQEERVRWYFFGADIILDIAPGTSQAKAIIEIKTGKDLEGKDIGIPGRAMAVAGFFPLGKLVAKGGQKLLKPLIKHGDEAADIAKATKNIPLKKGIKPKRICKNSKDSFLNGWRRLTVDDVPLPSGVKVTFRGGKAVGKVLEKDMVFYRVYGGTAARVGTYLTQVRPKSPAEAIRKLALNPDWRNSAVHLVEVRVPRGTVIWEGTARHQGPLCGGGSQIWVSSEQLVDDWFKVIPWSK